MTLSLPSDRPDGLNFGLSTLTPLASPMTADTLSRHPDDRYSVLARGWGSDVEDLTGVAARGRRAVPGWPDLQPEGPGRWDRAALRRVEAAVDEILAQGLRPEITLSDNDVPRWLDERGGWRIRETALRYADFAEQLGRRIGDRVSRWVTTPELASLVTDHVAGMRPPSRGGGPRGLAALHHALLGGGLADQALRAAAVTGRVGAAVPLFGAYPATDDPYDRLAADDFEQWAVRLFTDPLLTGHHMAPEGLDAGRPLNPATLAERPGDMSTISRRPDFLTLHWQVPCWVTVPENLPRTVPAQGRYRPLLEANRLLARLGFALVPSDDLEANSIGLPVMPEAIADAVARLQQQYGPLLPPLDIVDRGKGDLGPGKRAQHLKSQLFWLSRLVDEGLRLEGFGYLAVTDDTAWKLSYAQAYGRAKAAVPPDPLPALPCEWASTGPFKERPRPVRPGSPVVLLGD
ncbi:family 1 glycosylhydrolase [Streptomyces sp. NPDC058247]|uniref:family 1 glycosylhydrolase n=1 Tax=Streptomyces sp. NPDC058247 TaxID=3346401 RepID=UPI0036E67A50